jgi:hypothetical protein
VTGGVTGGMTGGMIGGMIGGRDYFVKMLRLQGHKVTKKH